MTLGSQLLLKKAIVIIGPLLQDGKIAFLIAAFTSPYVWTAISMQGLGFVLWMIVLTKLKLGIAFALSGAFFYLLIALSTWYIYGEKLTSQQWGGLMLISTGVVLMTLSK
jgi:multidrug transporter EmrE-like cation transporter